MPTHGLEAVLVAVGLVLASGRPSAEQVLTSSPASPMGPVPPSVATARTVGTAPLADPQRYVTSGRGGDPAEWVADFKRLRPYGMADRYAERLEQGQPAIMTVAALLTQRIQAETPERATRSITRAPI